MITDMAVGTTISIALATKAKHSSFFAGPFKEMAKILVTVVHQDKLIAMGKSHVMKVP